MARHWKIVVAVLALFFIFGVMTLPSLLRSVLRLQNAGETNEQARRAITQTAVATPTDAPAKAQMYWASSSPGVLEASTIDLPLSADPLQRSRQVLSALIARPSATQRTLPADTELLAFYLLPGGTGIADFSESLATATPSGILSEQAAIDSIVRTLAANVPAVHSLKILIHGQEVDTLAGHIDLTGFFPAAAPAAGDTAAPSDAGSQPASASVPGAPAGAPARQ
jgi:hypothetical protein